MDPNQPQNQPANPGQPPAGQPPAQPPAGGPAPAAGGAAPQGGQGDNQRLKIDDNMLHQIGLGQLPPHEKNRLLAQIYETLELRVGMTLANQMSDDQLKEFETFIDGNDESGALNWLESNFPNYKQVVAQELEKLKNEVAQNAPAIIQAVNSQPQGPPQGYAQPPAAGQPFPPAGQPAAPPQQPPAGEPQMPPAGQPPAQPTDAPDAQQPQPGQTIDPNQQS